MRVSAVIFDLDGTITEPYLDFDAIRAEIGVGATAGPLLELMDGMSEEDRGRAERILLEHERRAMEESRLNPGAKETLDALRDRGIGIGVLTRNARENALAVAAMHGLEFDVVVGRGEGPAKPDPFGVRYICKALGAKCEETLMVGDYLFDLVTAKNAGAIAVWLRNDHHRGEDYSDEADITISSLKELLKIIHNS